MPNRRSTSRPAATTTATMPSVPSTVQSMSAVRLDDDLDGERLTAAADEDRPAGRRRVEVVAADRDPDVMGLGQDPVGRIEALPADLRQVELDPGVRGLALALVRLELGRLRSRVDVPAHVARRDAHQSREADEQIGEVLADAAPVDVG